MTSKNLTQNLLLALVPTAIFAAMEMATGTDLAGLPWTMYPPMYLMQYAILWLFGYLKNERVDDKNVKWTWRILIALLILFVITLVWVLLIVDQWPCFTGVPNCD